LEDDEDDDAPDENKDLRKEADRWDGFGVVVPALHGFSGGFVRCLLVASVRGRFPHGWMTMSCCWSPAGTTSAEGVKWLEETLGVWHSGRAPLQSSLRHQHE